MAIGLAPFSFARHLASGREPTLTITGAAPRPFSRIIAVTIGPNPTYDYYLAPRLRHFPELEIRFAELDAIPALDEAALIDALIFFCRYTSPDWLDLVERHRHRIAGTALLLDDDLDALTRDRVIPLAARRRFYQRGVRQWPRLSRVLDLLFVSTPVLARRFADGHARLLPPIADEADLPGAPASRAGIGVAFHGTGIHGNESRWLVPIARNVLDADPAIRFEILARGRLAATWRRLDRVAIVGRRSWPQYRQATREHGPDIMLAPLLPSRLNASRAETKRIDAARSRAALLVSDADIYRPSDAEKSLGMLIGLDPPQWERGILDLARDPARLRALVHLNRDHVMAARTRQPPLLVPQREHGQTYWRFDGP